MSLKPVINNQTYFADLLTLSSGHLNIGSSFPEDKQLRILLVKYPEVFCEDRFELGFGGAQGEAPGGFKSKPWWVPRVRSPQML